MPGVLITSSSPLTDRMLVHTSFLRVLSGYAEPRIWATSFENERRHRMWRSAPAVVQPFPRVRPFPEFPINWLRRTNNFAWDFRLRNPSRLSMMRHIRDRSQRWWVRMLKNPARLVALLGLHEQLERWVEREVIACNRSPEAVERLRDMQPDAVLSMGPLRYEESAIVAAARRSGIPVLAFITSWDNISIKHRMVIRHDGYLVWSERMKQELLAAYPQSRHAPIHIVGAPQFDAFFRPEHYLTRSDFCARYGLRPERPLIVHAMGVANNIDEHHAALDLAQRVVRGDLGDAQLIVRPHPFQNHMELRPLFARFGPRVVLQQSGDPAEARTLRSQDWHDLVEWVNTFRHADVVVHLSSTVAIDAAIFDRPSVCMDYDPTPGRPRQALVREVNHLWTHYKPIAESGGMRLADSPEEVVAAVLAYLRNPGLDRAERRAMAERVCGYLDGKCGERMAEAVGSFLAMRSGNRLCEAAGQR